MDEQIEDKELQKSYWFLTHFEKMRRIGFDIGYGIDAVIVLFVLGVGIFLGVDFYLNRGFMASIRAPLVHESPSQLVADIGIQQGGLVPSSAAANDAYAVIVNPNAEWRARGTLVFMVDGKEYPVAFVLYPSQTRYVIRPGIPAGVEKTVAPQLKNVAWYRVVPRDNDRLQAFSQLQTGDGTFVDLKSLGIDAPRASFSIKNDSAFSFWEIEVPIAVLSGTTVVAVHDVIIKRLKSAETRHIEVQWPSFFDISSGATLSIDPVIDVFDPSVYMHE